MYRVTSLLAVLCLWSWLPSQARAYCRATTVPGSLACPADCASRGESVAWAAPEIEYAFNMRGFPGVDDAALRLAIEAAFAVWADVSCAGKPLGFRFSALAATTDLTVGPIASEPNLNVISLLSASEWLSAGFSASEFARTKVWYDEQNGEIVGADIAFNGAVMPFQACADSTSCALDTVDLQNVATHEIGHLLGLAHSQDRTATMWCDAQRGDHGKRILGADDLSGICAIYGDGFVAGPPADGELDPTQQMSRGADCGVGSSRTQSAWALEWGSLLALLLTRRLTRSVQRAAPTRERSV